MRRVILVCLSLLLAGCATTTSAPTRPECLGAADGGLRRCLSQKDIMDVIVAHVREVESCVDLQLAREPGITGTLVLRWSIHTSGEVGEVSVEKELPTPSWAPRSGPSPFATCLQERIATWKFPPHEVPQEPVQFPIKL